MAGDSYQELPRAKRRRLIARAVLRSLVFATVLVVLYYLLPLDRPLSADTAVRLLAGLLVFAGVMVWQVRKIIRSRYPGAQAVEALGLIVPLFLVHASITGFDDAPCFFGLVAADEQNRVAIEHVEDQVGIGGPPRPGCVQFEFPVLGRSFRAVEPVASRTYGSVRPILSTFGSDAGPLVEQVQGQRTEVDGDLG